MSTGKNHFNNRGIAQRDNHKDMVCDIRIREIEQDLEKQQHHDSQESEDGESANNTTWSNNDQMKQVMNHDILRFAAYHNVIIILDHPSGCRMIMLMLQFCYNILSMHGTPGGDDVLHC